MNNNKLTSVPPETVQLKKLKRLILHDNPLDIKIPPEILDKDPQTILNYYFEHKEGETRPLNEAKLILVGQGSVGKTSLVKQ